METPNLLRKVYERNKMPEIDRIISVNIQIRVEGSQPEYLGSFVFFALPRVGEIIHVKVAGEERSVAVLRVEYWGHSHTDNTFDTGSTLLTCSEIRS